MKIRIYKEMKVWRYGDMEIWRYGDMEIWRYGDMHKAYGSACILLLSCSACTGKARYAEWVLHVLRTSAQGI
jgi:hypothetical protein